MSNLSDIGFPVKNEDEFVQLAEQAFKVGTQIEAANGFYVWYRDPSGAELWVQLNNQGEAIGMNPHFHGKSNRTVGLVQPILDGTELDGAFYAWAEPADAACPESGAYPFVFALPDYSCLTKLELPQTRQVQLSAFAIELNCHADEKSYYDSQGDDPGFASQSFIPSGLFMPDEEDGEEAENGPEALGIFAGVVKETERRTNSLTNAEFYWLLVETLGGEVDVVADPELLGLAPTAGNVILGQFWLSGRLINPAAEAAN